MAIVKGTDAYATVADAARVLEFGSSFPSIPEDQQEAYLRMATRLMDDHFIWAGHRVDPAQPLGFPRTGVRGRGGRFIASSIPEPVTSACVVFGRSLALKALTDDNPLELLAITETMGVKFDAGRASRQVVPGEVRDLIPATFFHGLRAGHQPRAAALGRLTDGR